MYSKFYYPSVGGDNQPVPISFGFYQNDKTDKITLILNYEEKPKGTSLLNSGQNFIQVVEHLLSIHCPRVSLNFINVLVVFAYGDGFHAFPYDLKPDVQAYTNTLYEKSLTPFERMYQRITSKDIPKTINIADRDMVVGTMPFILEQSSRNIPKEAVAAMLDTIDCPYVMV